MLRSSFLLVAAVGITAFLSPAPAHADDMSDMADWCTKATAPSSVVICSDLELRRMAVIRNKIFADARASFTPDDMKDLSEDQNHWIHEYSADCGAAVNGPPVSLPVRQDTIDCFKQAGRERVAELVRNVRDVIPGYQAPSVSGSSSYATQTPPPSHVAPQPPPPAAIPQPQSPTYNTPPPAVSSERAEREKAAEEARLRLQEQAEQDKLTATLKERGFRLLSPADLDLDWRDLMPNNTKIAVRGTYVAAHDMEELSTPDNKDEPIIRLYTDSASRPARKTMLECRNSGFVFSACEMVVGATIQSCIRNKGELNEKEVPCLKVQDAFVIP
jgi:uncharacterized protein YecT (DUF1311 family)